MARDPELRYLKGDTVICTGAVAVKQMKKDDADFFNFQVWGKSAEFLAENAKKGSPVVLTGNLQQEKWEDKDGNKRERTVINCQRVDTLEWADEQPKSNSKSSGRSSQPDDDLPF